MTAFSAAFVKSTNISRPTCNHSRRTWRNIRSTPKIPHIACGGCPTNTPSRVPQSQQIQWSVDRQTLALSGTLTVMERRLEDRVLELSRWASGLSRPSPKFASQWTRLKTVFEACVEKQRRWENTGEPERRRCYPPSNSSSG
jgi:hypothetical protein